MGAHPDTTEINLRKIARRAGTKWELVAKINRRNGPIVPQKVIQEIAHRQRTAALKENPPLHVRVSQMNGGKSVAGFILQAYHRRQGQGRLW